MRRIGHVARSRQFSSSQSDLIFTFEPDHIYIYIYIGLNENGMYLKEHVIQQNPI